MIFKWSHLSCIIFGVSAIELIRYVTKQYNIILNTLLFKKVNRKPNGAFWDLVGHTPLVQIKCLSEDLGIEVWGKAEFTNPGGSIKDRVAKSIIQHAEKNLLLKNKGDIIYEGTSGSTGISLTMAAKCRGYQSSIYLPNDQAIEKMKSLKVLGATISLCPPCSIIDPNHYYNASKNDASRNKQSGLFSDQFENLANFQTHYSETAVEIWEQTHGKIDAFIASSGTGGTIAGVGVKLKEFNPKIEIILADPQGSGLYNKIQHGVMYNTKDAEGHRTRHVFDTIIEGVGINRLTQNFMRGLHTITQAYSVSDLEAVHMSRYLIEKDGLFVGSSSALNCCAVVKAVQAGKIPKKAKVVVMLCDSGVRHLSRFYNDDYLSSLNLLPQYLVKDLSDITGLSDMSNKVEPHRKENQILTNKSNKNNKIKYLANGDLPNSICAANKNTPPSTVLDFID